MFSVMELRVIRSSIYKAMDEMKDKLSHLDPESDDSVEITNDLMIYQNVIEKINEREDV